MLNTDSDAQVLVQCTHAPTRPAGLTQQDTHSNQAGDEVCQELDLILCRSASRPEFWALTSALALRKASTCMRPEIRPEFWMPPSAMMGTPARLATRATWNTAVACPRPTAHTCTQKQEPCRQTRVAKAFDVAWTGAGTLMPAAESHADGYDMCTTARCDTCVAVALPAAECCTRQGTARCNAATLCRKGFLEMHSCCRGRHFLTSCVVQMEPEPMPTRRPSAPAAIRFRACRDVTTLPQMTSSPSQLALTHRSISTWYVESPAEHRG